VRIKTGLMSLV